VTLEKETLRGRSNHRGRVKKDGFGVDRKDAEIGGLDGHSRPKMTLRDKRLKEEMPVNEDSKESRERQGGRGCQEARYGGGRLKDQKQNNVERAVRGEDHLCRGGGGGRWKGAREQEKAKSKNAELGSSDECS